MTKRYQYVSSTTAKSGPLYSVLDIVGVLNAQDDYTKKRNNWINLYDYLTSENV